MSLDAKMPEDRWIEPSKLRIYVRVEGNINLKRREDTISWEMDCKSLSQVDDLFSFVEAGINAFEDSIAESNSEPAKFSDIVSNMNEKPKRFSDITLNPYSFCCNLR
jgi:hypothetical protein